MKIYQEYMEENSMVSILSHVFLLYIVFITPLDPRNHLVSSIYYLSFFLILLFLRVLLIYIPSKNNLQIIAELSIYLTGIWWSTLLSVELYYSTSFDTIDAVLLFLIIGIASGGAFSMFKKKRLVILYILILMLPTLISMYYSGMKLGGLLAGAMLLFIGFNIVYSTKHNKIWQNLQKNKEKMSAQAKKLKLYNKELNLALEESKDAARIKSEFLANMSHEIRTPMNGIIGAADILRDMQLDVEIRKMVNIIYQSGNSLVTIINDILDFSKIEAGKMEIEYVSFDLLQSIENTIDILKTNAEKKKLELIFFFSPKIKHKVIGDETRINQVLINLVGNAIKFTEKGQVFVKVDLLKESEEYYTLKFSVEDTGIGIPPKYQEKIFESFTQANGSTTRRFGGTGLGTTISKMLVELMGGEITLQSPNPNNIINDKGSIFYFLIKLKKGDLLQQTIKINKKIEGKRALIIDDNETNCFVLNVMLKNWGIKAQEVYNGLQAEDHLKNYNDYDLIFLDYNMPRYNGYQVFDKIRKLLKKKTKVIMISSNYTEVTQKEIQRRGIDSLFYKPIKQSDLKRNIVDLFFEKIIVSPQINNKKKYQFNDLQILVVEDNIINQKIALSVLKQVNIQADIANNGQEALDKFQQKQYDLVFMDIQMPILDGIETVKRMRDLGMQTIVIAMTANAMKGDMEMCLKAGMNDYISKPFKKEKLYELLKKYTA
jgi:signal transduction histidine kinase/DNA-binding response OmpR family regulator